ncbi:hypothetical protein MKX08_007952 [Trichoderma sp. CBMAI-0020]|nr:hypothetical protein MKX08_007952 [Trichoderma sp. CBMAI-0020]
MLTKGKAPNVVDQLHKRWDVHGQRTGTLKGYDYVAANGFPHLQPTFHFSGTDMPGSFNWALLVDDLRATANLDPVKRVHVNVSNVNGATIAGIKTTYKQSVDCFAATTLTNPNRPNQ